MNRKIFLKGVLLSIFYLMISACTETVELSIDAIGTDGSGAPISISSIGPIVELNANDLSLNGVKFDTSSSKVTIDGEPGMQSDLQVGQVVIVTGVLNEDRQTGIADTVVYETNVLGPVDDIDPANAKLVVMGQSVFTSADTIFVKRHDELPDFNQLTDARVGYILRVSGQVNSNGGINATYIELVAENINEPGVAELLEVSGQVESLNIPAMEFNINELVVNYSAANLQFELSDGAFVQVQGDSIADSGELEADFIEVVNVNFWLLGSAIELEGLVTRFASVKSFAVNGIEVITNGSTIFQGGTAEDLALNHLVEVEGTINDNNEIVADRVILLDVGEVMIQGVSAPGLQHIGDQLIVSGGWASINVTPSTFFRDDSQVQRDPLFSSDLQPNDYLEIWGKRSDAGNGAVLIDATRIIRKDRRIYYANDSENKGAEIIGVIDSVIFELDRFTSFSLLNKDWSPLNAGYNIRYFNEQGIECELSGPDALIGKKVRIALYKTEAEVPVGNTDVFRMWLLSETTESECS